MRLKGQVKAAGAGQEPATWVWGSLARLSGLNLDSLNLAPDNLTKQRPCGVLRRHAGNYRYSVEIAGRPRLSHICQGRVGQCQTWGPLVFQVTGADRWMGHGAGIFPYVKDQTSNRRPLSTEPRVHVTVCRSRPIKVGHRVIRHPRHIHAMHHSATLIPALQSGAIVALCGEHLGLPGLLVQR